MSGGETPSGHAIVMQPMDGPSYWQPVPANGFAHVKLSPEETRFNNLSMGYQSIPPGGRVREHAHAEQVELQICFRGKGRVMVDGIGHELVPGTACFLGYDVKHEIVNEGDDDLVMIWIVSPSGLENFLKTIGRPRHEGEPAPEPFARPKDTTMIEHGFGLTYSE